MEKGKFSQPRPYRDEERQIEETFRQITEKEGVPRHPVKPTKRSGAEVVNYTSEETVLLPQELLELAQQTPIPEGPICEPVEPIEDSISREIEKAYPDLSQQPPAPPKNGKKPEPFPEIDPEEWEDDPQDDPADSFPEAAFAFFQKYSRWILTGIFALALLLIVGVISVFIGGRSQQEDMGDRIARNVMVAGVNVGGMSKEEAIRAVKSATAYTYTQQDMVVTIAGTQILLSPQDTGAKLDVEAAIEAAYAYGRTGTQEQQEQDLANSLKGNHTIGLLPYLQLDKDFIRLVLNNAAGDSGSTLTQASYGLEGPYPSLSVKDFDPASAQTLVLTMGTPGVSFDPEKAYNQILDAYSLHIFEVTVTDVQSALEPDPVDLTSIYAELYVAPVDDSVNLQTFETIPGSYGYEFDLEAAQKLVDTAQYGQVIRIPMVFIAPEMMEENILFRDVMGEYQTKLTGSSSLIHNVQLACQAIDGKVIQPGEMFSFNTTLGEPTANKGYQKAPVLVGTIQEEIMGGGISQSATTLYCASMIADMEIVSRTNHSQPVSYVDMGLDAYVNWGGADLKFRNNGIYPVQIRATASGGYVTIQILGTDNRDYFIKLDHSVTNVQEPKTKYEDFPYDNSEGYQDGDVIENGYNGYTVKTYRLKYSRSTGKKLSSDFETTSRYDGKDTLIARVAPPETTEPETTVPETTVPETAVPETTIPETQAPENDATEPPASEDVSEAADPLPEENEALSETTADEAA